MARGRSLHGASAVIISAPAAGIQFTISARLAFVARSKREVSDFQLLMPSLPSAGVVAIGDVHGDYAGFVAALRLGGAIDKSNEWVGGDMRVVQVLVA